MTALTGKTVGSPDFTYLGLLHFEDNSEITGSLKKIQDGDGNDTGIELSTAKLKYTGTLEVNGTVELSTVKGLVESIGLQDINTNIAATTYVLEFYAAYPYTINQLKIIAGAGTCTAAVKINGTNVTGISAVSVSTSVATGTATAANTVSVGDKVTLVISSTSGLENLQASIKTTRS